MEFKIFILSFLVTMPLIAKGSEERCRKSVEEISRRGFLKASLVTAAAMTLAPKLGMAQESSPTKTSSHSDGEQLPRAKPTLGEKLAKGAEFYAGLPRLLKVSLETLVYQRLNRAIAGYFVKNGTNMGNARLSEMTVANLIASSKSPPLIMNSVIVPLYEEGIFRALPALISKSWWVGVPSSILFGFFHNLIYEPKTKKIRFNRKAFPLSQIISGHFLWWQMKERGFWYGVYSHGLMNFKMPNHRFEKSVIRFSRESGIPYQSLLRMKVFEYLELAKTYDSKRR